MRSTFFSWSFSPSFSLRLTSLHTPSHESAASGRRRSQHHAILHLQHRGRREGKRINIKCELTGWGGTAQAIPRICGAPSGREAFGEVRAGGVG
jgi:hypothetical protein